MAGPVNGDYCVITEVNGAKKDLEKKNNKKNRGSWDTEGPKGSKLQLV